MSITAYDTVLKFIKEHDELKKKFDEQIPRYSFGDFVDVTGVVEDFLSSLNDEKERDFIRALIYITVSETGTPLFKKCLERAVSLGFIPAIDLIMSLRSLGIYDSYPLIRAYIVYDWRP